MAKSFPFVVHDESLNTQGFRMLTAGAGLSVFDENPVMLLNHQDWETPIGRWENVRIEGSRILADAVFDEADETGAKIMGKVERGFLKACSVGVRPTALSSDPALMLPGQEYPTVTKWELREISICTIGANHNALALYDKENNLVNDKNNFLKLFDVPQGAMSHINNNNMSKLTALLRLSDSASEDAIMQEAQRIIQSNEQLTTENTTLKGDKIALTARLEVFETKEKTVRKAETVTLLDAAVRDGRINADGRPAWEKSFESDFESAKAQLSSIPKPATVHSQVQTGKTLSGVIALADMTFADILKANRLKELKGDADLYRQKFFEAYGRYPA